MLWLDPTIVSRYSILKEPYASWLAHQKNLKIE